MIGLQAFGLVLPTMSVSPLPIDYAPMHVHLCVYTYIHASQVVHDPVSDPVSWEVPLPAAYSLPCIDITEHVDQTLLQKRYTIITMLYHLSNSTITSCCLYNGLSGQLQTW